MRSRFFSGTAAYAVAAVLVVLVIVLAVFQHSWFGQLSERERERMKSNIRNGGFRFSMEVERELSRLQVLRNDEPETAQEKLGVRLQEQLEILRASTEYSGLVENVFVVNDSLKKAWLLVGEKLVPVSYPPGDWSVPYTDGAIWALIGPGPTSGILLRKDLRVLCIPQRQRPPRGSTGEQVVVTLNRDFLVDSIFSQMLDRNLGSQGFSDLDVLLLHERDDVRDVLYASSDAAKSIESDNADVVLPFLRGMPPGLSPGSRQPLDERFGGPGDGGMRLGPYPMTSFMELRIRHRAGSLEAVVRQNRLINVGIGSGILLLFLAGIGLILVISRNAERLARQQIEFVAGISHELRTPLAVLQSVGDNLADGVITEITKARSYGRIVRTEVHRLHAMVENALTYAGITSGKYPADLHPVDLRHIVRKACQSSQAMLEEHGVRLDVDLPETLPQISGDAPALQSALENLLSNAVKYSSENPWIGVVVAQDQPKGEVTLAVSDCGMGIARQEIPHLFEPFYRGREAIQQQIRGSGLGLNLVHHIIERHGGSVTVESTPGRGSRFIVHLPAHSIAQGKKES
jgi:signal transduction histidine kinase